VRILLVLQVVHVHWRIGSEHAHVTATTRNARLAHEHALIVKTCCL
jgi:hypothetical protein